MAVREAVGRTKVSTRSDSDSKSERMRNPSIRRRLRASGPLAALLDAAEHVWWKVQLFSVALLHLLFSSDKSWLHLPHAAATRGRERGRERERRADMTPLMADERDAGPGVIKRKRIVFVRHAESEWNVVFNRGLNLRMLLSLARAVVREWLLLPSSDSVFLDSPLSRRGRFQAQNLQEQVCETSLRSLEGGGDVPLGVDTDTPSHHAHRHSSHQTEERALLRYLCCPLPNSVIVASNLRRTIDTARIASASRLELPGEKIHVLSCLQEIGRNLDTLAISDPHTVQPPEVLAEVSYGEKHHDELFNVSESYGNKAVLGCGRDRLLTFAQWVFRQPQDVVIVYGHSLWFRAFCREFFPHNVYHEAKSVKLANCGAVSFMLQERAAGGGEPPQYSIQPESFQHLI